VRKLLGKQVFIKIKVRCRDNIKISLREIDFRRALILTVLNFCVLYCREVIYCKIEGICMYVVRRALASMAICSW
jgi:hypothetical protein